MGYLKKHSKKQRQMKPKVGSKKTKRRYNKSKAKRGNNKSTIKRKNNKLSLKRRKYYKQRGGEEGIIMKKLRTLNNLSGSLITRMDNLMKTEYGAGLTDYNASLEEIHNKLLKYRFEDLLIVRGDDAKMKERILGIEEIIKDLEKELKIILNIIR